MRYMLLIYSDPAALATMTETEGQQMLTDYLAFTQSVVASGEMVGGDPLQGIATATTVRVRAGRTTTTDGPFAETKEVLGGYYNVIAPDYDAAIAIAKGSPHLKYGGSIEVRKVDFT